MREIKFRGKRIDNGDWTTGDLIQLLGEQGGGRKFIVDNRFGACIDSDGSFVNTEAPFVNEVDPETVGQYTGLKDRNDKEVYEGGILHDDFGGHYYGGVYWSDDWAMFTVKGEKVEAIMRWTSVSEIVGNIYENPELIDS